MKIWIIILSFFVSCCLQAQTSFKTVIPQQAVIEGEAFQVQYVLTGAERTSAIRTPVFPGFRLISGPNIYLGTTSTSGNTQLVQNFVYTLEAVQPGRFVIPGALVAYNNKPFQSNEVMLKVISQAEAVKGLRKKEQAFSSDYYLRPGEDPYKKIKENLFVKVHVDRTSCFIGEPVQATFKLYSRLESRSDIIKNPGFYGFTVHDMIGLADKQVSTEKINGNLFDVHTIRKVQLYALQAGDFTIDPMEIKNSVEFSRSRVNKKTEQEIAEGMMEDEPGPPVDGTDIFETHTRTNPVIVHVRSLPVKNKPPGFSGAVGRFEVKTRLVKTGLARNEEGFLEIAISGKGNFTQLDAPKPEWPAGIEGFDPVVRDALDKSNMPLSGSRTFRYPFVCASPGSYQMPSISFSFFDTDSNSYKTITSKPIEVTISTEEKKSVPVTEEKSTRINEDKHVAWIAAAIAIGVVLIVILYWTFNKKAGKEEVKIEVVEGPVSGGDLLEPVSGIYEERPFYTSLREAVWTFLSARFDLSGSGMSKQLLVRRMKEKNISDEKINTALQILDQCDAGIFTSAEMGENREDLLAATKVLFKEIEAALL